MEQQHRVYLSGMQHFQMLALLANACAYPSHIFGGGFKKGKVLVCSHIRNLLRITGIALSGIALTADLEEVAAAPSPPGRAAKSRTFADLPFRSPGWGITGPPLSG